MGVDMILNRVLTLVCVVVMIAISNAAQAEYNEEHFRVYDGRGNASSVDAIIEAAGGVDAVFLGELHDDAVGHAVQMEIFRRAVGKYGADRKMALSLEMFERDVQIVVDEYMAGLIREDHFMLSTRAWGNYKTDYRPLVELAKERRLPVIAANAPRRYINMVSRNGRGALDRLSKDARKWLAPLPYAEPSPAYAAKFKSLMGPSAEARMGLDNILASQTLWDATMADSVARFVKKNKNPLVIHLNGGFHTESRLGMVEHFLKYRSKAKALVVTMRYEDDFKNFDPAKHTGLGDFVVLTDAKQPRSKR
jgi:uncharacterized iron-regulated protein